MSKCELVTKLGHRERRQAKAARLTRDSLQLGSLEEALHA